MCIELADERLRISIRRVNAERYRLTLDFPPEQWLCDRVRLALADLIRPSGPSRAEGSEGTEAGREEIAA